MMVLKGREAASSTLPVEVSVFKLSLLSIRWNASRLLMKFDLVCKNQWRFNEVCQYVYTLTCECFHAQMCVHRDARGASRRRERIAWHLHRVKARLKLPVTPTTPINNQPTK
jgi:hypothetical protein